jgi:hypothetical protein
MSENSLGIEGYVTRARLGASPEARGVFVNALVCVAKE